MQFLKVFIRRQLPSLNVSSEVRSFTDVVVSFPPPPSFSPAPSNTHTHTNVLQNFREVVEQYIFARFGKIAFKRGIRFPNFMDLFPAVSMYRYSLSGLHQNLKKPWKGSFREFFKLF